MTKTKRISADVLHSGIYGLGIEIRCESALQVQHRSRKMDIGAAHRKGMCQRCFTGSDALVPNSLLFLIANIVPTSKAPVTTSVALVPSSLLFLIANIVPTSKAPVTTSVALVPSSLLFLIANIVPTSKAPVTTSVRHLFLVAYCF